MFTQILMTALSHPLLVSASVWLADDYDYASDEGGAWFWLLGPAGGIGFYMWVFLRYRNTDKRHAFEHESTTEVRDLRTHDQRVDRISGTSESSIRGRNSHKPLSRLGRGTTVVELPAPKPSVVEAATDAATGAQAGAATPQQAQAQESATPADPQTPAAGV